MLFNIKKTDKSEKKEQLPKKQSIVIDNLVTEDENILPHVVNLKSGEKYDIYIGRPGANQPMNFGNPFVIGKDGNRDEVIDKFEAFLLNNTELMERVKKELKGKTLGCFCFPLKCHGDVLLKYANPELFMADKPDIKKPKI